MKPKCLPITIAAAVAAFSAGIVQSAQPIGCIIEPDRVAEVGSPAVGVIQSIQVERGDYVRKGQVLAVLRHDVEQAAVDVAQSRAQTDAEVRAASANYEFVRQRLTRSEDLYHKQFISKQALDQVIAEAKVAEQRLVQARDQQQTLANETSLARARVAERTIRSPIDGIITERYVSAGERVEEKPLVRVAKIDPLRVEVIMPSTAFGSVVAGMPARILPDLPGAAPQNAKVSLVDKIIDGPSNTFRVRLYFPNPQFALPSGLRCKAEFGENLLADRALPDKTGISSTDTSSARKMNWQPPADRLPNARPARKM
ncbi:MAG: efflux RND transporter periplasmic adaptor subunit [Betaproteobacteria bacterium]|nr:efflux RND transporter periplasmic adaptor subunit [Betaproteobacteria bacterium]